MQRRERELALRGDAVAAHDAEAVAGAGGVEQRCHADAHRAAEQHARRRSRAPRITRETSRETLERLLDDLRSSGFDRSVAPNLDS